MQQSRLQKHAGKRYRKLHTETVRRFGLTNRKNCVVRHFDAECEHRTDGVETDVVKNPQI